MSLALHFMDEEKQLKVLCSLQKIVHKQDFLSTSCNLVVTRRAKKDVRSSKKELDYGYVALLVATIV